MKIFILTLLAVATFVWPIETAILVWTPWCVIASINYENRRHKENQALGMIKTANEVVFAFADFLAEREAGCCPIHDASELPHPKKIIEEAFHLLVEHYEQIKKQSPELADVEFEKRLNSIKCCWAILYSYQESDKNDNHSDEIRLSRSPLSR